MCVRACVYARERERLQNTLYLRIYSSHNGQLFLNNFMLYDQKITSFKITKCMFLL